MPAVGVVPALDEVEDHHPRFGLGFETPTVDQLAFQRREETLCHGVVVGISHRAHGWFHVHLATPKAEGNRGVLGTLVRMVDDAIRGFRSDR